MCTDYMQPQGLHTRGQLIPATYKKRSMAAGTLAVLLPLVLQYYCHMSYITAACPTVLLPLGSLPRPLGQDSSLLTLRPKVVRATCCKVRDSLASIRNLGS